MKPFDSVSLLERATPLDRVVDPLRSTVQSLLGTGRARDALHGVWLGHPLHPTLVQVSIGALFSASLLDALGGEERAADTLVGAGLLSAAPTAVSGWADWSELHEEQQRVGLVHAVTNIAALGLYAASLAARRSGARQRGKSLSYAGLGLLGFAGFLGGHLSFRQAAGANHAAVVPHLVRTGWHDLCALDDLAGDGVPQRHVLGPPNDNVPVLVVRSGERIDVLSDRCSHLAGPLHEGDVDVVDTTVTCPLHGSRFSLDDGSVRRGPATAPVPAFDVRVESGRVEVRLPSAT